MKNERPELVIIAEEQDDVIGDSLKDLIPRPRKPYKGQTVKALADAVAEVMALMDVEAEPMAYEGQVEELDADLVRFLGMVAQAAADYGQPMPLGPEEIRGDNELIVITDHLKALASDRDFRDWLDEELDEEFDMEEEDESEDEDEDEDALLMGRM